MSDAVAMVTQEAELNELRATIELLRQQGHAQLSPLRRPPLTVSTPQKDLSSNGQSSLCVIYYPSTTERMMRYYGQHVI